MLCVFFMSCSAINGPITTVVLPQLLSHACNGCHAQRHVVLPIRTDISPTALDMYMPAKLVCHVPAPMTNALCW